MLVVEQGQVFLQSLQAFWGGVIAFLPSVILALLIFVIGAILASLVGKAVAHVINLTKINRALENTSLKDTVNKAGFHLDIGKFIGWLVKWFFILAFLIAALNLLHLDTADLFLQQIVVVYLPRVIVAVLIVVIGSVLADLAAKIVRGSARVANVMSANFAGTIAHWAIWITTILFALDQLGVGSDLIQTLWIGIVAALALAFGLSFGLGGKEHASRTLERIGNMISRQ
jgi:hypothetical protein